MSMAITLVVAPITFTEPSKPMRVTEDNRYVDIIASYDQEDFNSSHRYEEFGEAEDSRQITKRSEVPSLDQLPPLINQIPPLKQNIPFEEKPLFNQIPPLLNQIPPLIQNIPFEQIPPIDQIAPVAGPIIKFKKFVIKKTPKLVKLVGLLGAGVGLGSLGGFGATKLLGAFNATDLIGGKIGKKAQWDLMKSMDTKLYEIEQKLAKLGKIEDLLIKLSKKHLG